MNDSNIVKLPREAFVRGIKRLKEGGMARGCLVLGFDCEYESALPNRILSYQLSDGTNSVLTRAEKDWTWQELSTWVVHHMSAWGHRQRDYSTVALISHFSTAELSHIQDFYIDAEVRRVSPQQVFNASYRFNRHLNIDIIDQYHFWNTSLAKVAETWGEQKMEYDTTNVSLETMNDPKFIEYAKWDAVVCQRTFQKFRRRVLEETNLDIVKYPTPASLAMAVFRLHYLEDDLAAPPPQVRTQAWRSLWGGRAEAYVQGDYFAKYTLRDVKSLYPTSGVNLGILPRSSDWKRLKAPKTWRGLCRVKFEFPRTTRFPCLPINHDGKLIFPLTGVSDCTLDEAKLAKELGAKLTFTRVYEYETGTDALKRYLTDYIAKKDAADKADDQPGRALSKLYMNAIIGKFSQNRGDVDIEDFKKFAAELGLPLTTVMSPAFHHPNKPKQAARIGGNIMPEWSALILGLSRATMARLLNDKDIDSLLCSTDSMLVPEHQNARVDAIMGTALVQLDNKNNKCKECPDGKAETVWVRVVRNRVYAAMCPHGNVALGANHAIHLPGNPKTGKASAYDFILSDEVEYRKTPKAGLKAAIRTGRKLFEALPERVMRFERTWDHKRMLHSDGTTQPWLDVHQYDAFKGRANLRSVDFNTHIPSSHRRQ